MNRTFPTDEVDVAIVGGGIIGCATAYYASMAGLRVALFDKGAIGFEQSTRNWGWVHQQVRHPHLIPLAMYSLKLWEGLEQALGVDLEWRQGGNFNFASGSDDVGAFERYQAAALAVGLNSRMLSAADTAALLPGLTTDIAGALHVPSDGQANPHTVTRAFADVATAAGATIVENCAAFAVCSDGSTVTGLNTERGLVRARHVVVAAGAWSRRVLSPLGLSIPQNALRSTVIRTTPAPGTTTATGWARGVAFRQDVRGRFILAAGEKTIYDVNIAALTDWRTFGRSMLNNRRRLKLRLGAVLLQDIGLRLAGSRSSWQRLRVNEPRPDLAAAMPNLRGLHELFPQLEELAVENIWAGNIDMTPDQAPVLDNQTSLAGLVIATGFSGHGFAMGPGAGHVVSDLLQERTPELDLHAFRLGRFAENDHTELAPFHPA